MDYSNDLLTKIENYAREMMTPTEISALLGIDERVLCDDIATVGCPARVAYVRALAGSPSSIQECQRLLAVALSAVT